MMNTVHNPILALPTMQRIIAEDAPWRVDLRALLVELRDHANAKAAESHRKHKYMMYAYWKVANVYVGHIIKAMGKAPPPKMREVMPCPESKDSHMGCKTCGGQWYVTLEEGRAPQAEALNGIVREMIFGEGTDASLQRVIDLCNEARSRFQIERVA